MTFQKHLFICTSCVGQNGEENIGLELQQSLKSDLKQNFPDKKLRVNKSGCLGKCRSGVNAVCYPAGKWFTHLTKNDLNTLKQELLDE